MLGGEDGSFQKGPGRGLSQSEEEMKEQWEVLADSSVGLG